MASPLKTETKITTLILVGLSGWGIYLAIGAAGYFVSPNLTNPVKSLIVLAMVVMFIAMWGAVLRKAHIRRGTTALPPAPEPAAESQPNADNDQTAARRAWNWAGLSCIGVTCLSALCWGLAIGTWQVWSSQATTILGWAAAMGLTLAGTLGMVTLSDRRGRRGYWLGFLGLLAVPVGLCIFFARMGR